MTPRVRRVLFGIFCINLLVFTPSCSSWIQELKNNPVAAEQQAVQVAQTVINYAQTGFAVLKGLLPLPAQVAAQAIFDTAIFAANHVITSLNDAVQTAIAAQTANPNFATILQNLSDAVTQIVAVVNNIRTQMPATATASSPLQVAANADVYNDLALGLSTLKKVSGTK